MSVIEFDDSASPLSIIKELQEDLGDIEGICVVVKYKDGTSAPKICMKAGDVAYAIVVLQQFLLENI